MSPPFADLSAALPQAPSGLSALPMTCLDDPFSQVPLYRHRRTDTARTHWRATLPAKACTVLCASVWVIALGSSAGFALPPTPETSDYKQTPQKPGGFLQGPFQVMVGSIHLDALRVAVEHLGGQRLR